MSVHTHFKITFQFMPQYSMWSLPYACALRTPYTSRSLILSPSQYSDSTNYEAPHYAFVFSLQSLPPSRVRIFFSTPHSQISITHVLPLSHDKKIHTLTQEQPKLHTILKTEAAKSSISPIPIYKFTP